jgi:hypothetical protein
MRRTARVATFPKRSGRGRGGERPAVPNYDALRDHLKKQSATEFVLSFDEIEEILGFGLPRASHRASWWETLRSPQEAMPQRVACIDGGYEATRLTDGTHVRFRRMTLKTRR